MAAVPDSKEARDVDVLIIGGGPAGSTAATLLAERGHQVTLLEKARHPRFHIGESLLPANLPLFERLGVADEMRAIGMQKCGAEFVSESLGRSEIFEFKDAYDPRPPYAYQVRRAEFDEILIRRASRAGAQVIEGCRVRAADVSKAKDFIRVESMHDDGRAAAWNARFLVDASGRDTFLAGQLGAKQRNRKHNSASMYAHFSGAQRYPGQRAGNISIYWFEHGWMWLIPLIDGTASVGAVVWPAYMKERHLPLEQFFMYTIAMCAPLTARLKNAQLVSPVEATGNYSYAADHSYGNRYLMVGDAYAFVDPVFSSGVWLAMNGAATAADAVDTFLRHPAKARKAMREYDRVTRLGPRVFSWFIYRITSPAMRDLFMNPRELLGVRSAVLSVLAGDIFGKTPIWKSLRVFKTFYMLTSIFNPRRTIAGWRDRAINIRPVSSQPAIRLECLSLTELQTRPESWWQGVLGVVSFGRPQNLAAARDIPNALVNLPRLGAGAETCEVWQATAPLKSGQHGAIRYRAGADVLFGSMVLDESTAPLPQLTSRAYTEIFTALDGLGYPHLLRVWNYFAEINGNGASSERYQEFNTARRKAFVNAGRAIEGQVPAACALGSAPGSPMVIYFIASKTAGRALENPRQVSAFRYPAEYGPDSPTFSRAMVSTALSGSCLFTSGTASIVGHQSMHAGDVAAQTRESIANIFELVAEANRVRGARRHAIEEMQFKVYVRHAENLEAIGQQLAQQLPPRCPVTYLQADVCRPDLLVEIEAVGDATPGNRPAVE